MKQAHISWAGQDTRGLAELRAGPCINRVANRLHLKAIFPPARTVVGHRYFQVYQDASQPRRTCALAWVSASICPAQLPHPVVTCASAQLLYPGLFVPRLVARCSGAFHYRHPGVLTRVHSCAGASARPAPRAMPRAASPPPRHSAAPPPAAHHCAHPLAHLPVLRLSKSWLRVALSLGRLLRWSCVAQQR